MRSTANADDTLVDRGQGGQLTEGCGNWIGLAIRTMPDSIDAQGRQDHRCLLLAILLAASRFSTPAIIASDAAHRYPKGYLLSARSANGCDFVRCVPEVCSQTSCRRAKARGDVGPRITFHGFDVGIMAGWVASTTARDRACFKYLARLGERLSRQGHESYGRQSNVKVKKIIRS